MPEQLESRHLLEMKARDYTCDRHALGTKPSSRAQAATNDPVVGADMHDLLVSMRCMCTTEAI